MKILLLLGVSGVGKTSIAKELYKNEDRYHYVSSFTDRLMRENNEWGHTFVNSDYMDLMFKDSNLVAKTTIDEDRYCVLNYQFDKDKVNIYITDLAGLNDVISFFPYADIMSILITRDRYSLADKTGERSRRNILLPCREDVDFLIENDSSIRSAVETIDTLVCNDWFRKPSHKATTIEDALKKVDDKRRHLNEIERSLQFQRWYRDKNIYIDIFNYLLEQDYDDFNIKIIKDNNPSWGDDECPYYFFVLYEEKDTSWVDSDRIYSLVLKHLHEYCDLHNLDMFYLRCDIEVLWEGLWEGDY